LATKSAMTGEEKKWDRMGKGRVCANAFIAVSEKASSPPFHGAAVGKDHPGKKVRSLARRARKKKTSSSSLTSFWGKGT